MTPDGAAAMERRDRRDAALVALDNAEWIVAYLAAGAPKFLAEELAARLSALNKLTADLVPQALDEGIVIGALEPPYLATEAESITDVP